MNRLPFTLLLFPAIAAASLSVDGLRCEFLKNPVGVENPSPRFSWIAHESDTSRRGQDITGFEIRVAKTVDGLGSETGCLWQTKGKGRDLAVCYQGPALDSGCAYFWKVRATDVDGILSPWSPPARFVLALQKRDEWSGAQWIGEPGVIPSALNAFHLTAKVSNIQDAFGIFFHASDASNACLWQFNRVVSGKLCLRPHIFQSGNPQFLPQTEIESKFPELCDWSKPHTVELDVKGETVRTFWDGKLVDERNQKPLEHGLFGFRTSASEGVDVHQLTVTDATGKPMIDERFQKRETCIFRDAEIKNGILILRGKSILNRSSLPKNCPRFRKTFELQAKPIREAYASVIGMGFYELYLNGERIDERRRESAPYSNFGSFLNFDTLEVTEQLRSGTRNTVGLWLAPGYSDDFSQWACKWEQPKRALFRLFVTYADNTAQTVVTDASWETTQRSPISYASIYGGETYDATVEDPTWCKPEGSHEGWTPVQIMPPYRGELRASLAEPTRIVERDRPVRITEPEPGVFIADFGQNRSAVVRIRAKGKRGTKIVMRHSELLGKDGKLDPWTNRGAKATDTFLLAGTGDWEVYEPHFTTHGFRYAEITGYPGKLTPDDIEQCAIHADLEYTGRFHCSNEGLNKLHNAARWSMLSNFHAYPSDCCMRDERTPCQMDSQAYEDTACMMFWMPRYYLNWLHLIERGRGWPCWNGDSVTLPMRLYRHYGDIRILQEQYSNMVYTTEGALANFPGNLFKDAFGDWCTPNDGTWAGYHGNPEVTDCAILGKMIKDLLFTVAFLRLKGEGQRWAKEYEHFNKIFHEKLFHADTHTYGNGSQTTAVLPLAFELVPAAEKEPVFRQLVKTIRDKDKSKVDTGIFGTRYIADVLCQYGEEDLAVHLMTQPEYPGYGFMFANGATTLWEQWTFRGGMNSHNHAMFSGGAHFLYSCIGGINPVWRGYDYVVIRPVFPKSLQFANASCQTIRGEIISSWKREDDTIVLCLSIPVGITAGVMLPAKPQKVTENGKVFAETKTHFAEPRGYANGTSHYRIQSGNYELRIH